MSTTTTPALALAQTRLHSAESEARLAATKQEAFTAIGEQLLAQIHSLKAQLEAAGAERLSGVAQVRLLAIA